MPGSNVSCSECGVKIYDYWQCPRKIEGRSCAHDHGYCAAHGGRERASPEMIAHIKEHDLVRELNRMPPKIAAWFEQLRKLRRSKP